MFNPVAPYRYLLPTLYLSVADIATPDLSLDIARFYCQKSSGSAWPACPKNDNRAPLLGREGRHNLHRVCQTVVTAPPRVGCVVWSMNMMVPPSLPLYEHYGFPLTSATCMLIKLNIMVPLTSATCMLIKVSMMVLTSLPLHVYLRVGRCT